LFDWLIFTDGNLFISFLLDRHPQMNKTSTDWTTEVRVIDLDQMADTFKMNRVTTREEENWKV
jgi:hypothetical protein